MKSKKLIALIAALALGLMVVGMNTLDTVHSRYLPLRAEADENASTIDLTTAGDFASMPAGAVKLLARDDGTGSGVNMIELVFCGGSAANKTFTYTIYAWRAGNGMARLVATGTGTLGTQAVVIYPGGSTATSKYWADTLSVTSRWIKSVVSSAETGSNETASLAFDGFGFEWIYVEITAADGATGDEAGDISVYYAYI